MNYNYKVGDIVNVIPFDEIVGRSGEEEYFGLSKRTIDKLSKKKHIKL